MTDRKRFYRVDLDFFHKGTCDRLLSELGPWGPLVWLALVAEAKRAHEGGSITVASEPHFWQLLGFYGDEHRLPDFTMDDFLRLTGRLKQTSKTRVGRLLHVTLTHFSEWQKEWVQDEDRARKNPRKPRKTRTEPKPEENGNKNRSDFDLDLEGDAGTGNPTEPAPLQDVYDHWRKQRHKTDPRYQRISPNRATKLRARLREFTPDELKQAITNVALDDWPERAKHDDLTVILRNREQVEKFLELGKRRCSNQGLDRAMLNPTMLNECGCDLCSQWVAA